MIEKVCASQKNNLLILKVNITIIAPFLVSPQSQIQPDKSPNFLL